MPKYNLSLKKTAATMEEKKPVNRFKLKKTASGEYKRVSVIKNVVVRPTMPPPPPPPFRKAEDSVLRQMLVHSSPPTISLLSEDENGGQWEQDLQLDRFLEAVGPELRVHEEQIQQQLLQEMEQLQAEEVEPVPVPQEQPQSPPPPLIQPQQTGKNLSLLMDNMRAETEDFFFHLPTTVTAVAAQPTCAAREAVGVLLLQMRERFATQLQQKRDRLSVLLPQQQEDRLQLQALEERMRLREEERNVLLRGMDEDERELKYIDNARGGGGGGEHF